MQKVIAVLLFSLFLLGGCAKDGEDEPLPIEQPPAQAQEPEPGDEPPPAAEPALLKGVSLSPKSYSGEDFTSFFQKATECGNLVMWAGGWDELAAAEGGGPRVVSGLAATYHYTPLVEVTYYSQGEGELIRPLTEAEKESYIRNAASFAEEHKPEYLGLGIEVNIMHAKSPQDFEEFAELYDEAYDAIKEKSPNTKVFTVFQLEHMKGLDGGLFGGENNPEDAQWSLIDRFPKSDAVAFTTYPCFIYKHPSEIPENYYSEIRSHTSKPILFTESGWFREGPEGWESSPEEQAEFITLFFELAEPLEPEIMVWSFLYDQEIQYPFNTMGLLSADEETSPAYEAWKEG